MDLSFIIPIVLAAVGFLSTLFFKNGKKKAEDKAVRMEERANREQLRAEVAEEVTEVIIESEKVAKENVKKAVEVVKNKRGRFTGADLNKLQ